MKIIPTFSPKSSPLYNNSKGLGVIIYWTPGHATIEGNEIADRLAKDAAQQASHMSLDTSVVTLQDIKLSSRKSVISKWQQCWGVSDSGRFFYSFKPKVNGKLFLDIPCKNLGSSILQLRIGYNHLNEYKYKWNQCESAECECGDI